MLRYHSDCCPTLPTQQIRKRFSLRHRRIGEDFRFGFISSACDAHARNDIVFGGVRVTDRFDIEQRLIRRAGEQQLAFTDKQVPP